MPTSHYFQLNEIITLIKIIEPQSVLDIGVGFGKYGVLSREYLDLCDGRDKYNDWKRRIDGIEAYAEYITPLHKFIYNNIYIGDAKDLAGSLEGYDLVLMIDVLEHFEKTDGINLLKTLLSKSKNVLISVPIGKYEQDAAFGNEYERHRSEWKLSEFKAIAPLYAIKNDQSLICLVGKDAGKVKQMMFKYKTAKLLRRLHLFWIYRMIKNS